MYKAMEYKTGKLAAVYPTSPRVTGGRFFGQMFIDPACSLKEEPVVKAVKNSPVTDGWLMGSILVATVS